MKTFLCGLAAFLFLSSAAAARPTPAQLSDTQMDSVTAGFTFQEEDVSNTIMCGRCYIKVNSPALSVGSAFGTLPF